MAIVPLFGLGFAAKSQLVTSQTLTNLYREPQPEGDKARWMYYGTPGTNLFTNGIGSNPCRGARSVGNFIYAVHGSNVYTINNAGSVNFLGSIGTSTGRVGMTDNGAQILIVDGLHGYVITVATGVLAQVASPNFPNGAVTCTVLNGYGIVDNNTAKLGQFNWSAQYDFTTWSALDFANAESNPDALVAVVANAGDLYLFGTATTEVWAPSGDTAIFRRIGGSGVEWGLPATWSVDKFDNTSLVLLAKNKLGQVQPVQMQGYQVKSLVDGDVPNGPDVAHDINTRTPGSATGYAWVRDAHTFYQLNFPDRSYLYDSMSNSWSLVATGVPPIRHVGEIRVELFGVPYVADYATGNWYSISDTAYTDNGTVIVREITSKHAMAGYDRFAIPELFVDFEVGDGLVTGQGSNPQAMLSWSKDGGRTFGTEVWQTMGAMGAYSARAVWYLLGIARDWVFRLRVTDPVKVVIVNAAMRV